MPIRLQVKNLGFACPRSFINTQTAMSLPVKYHARFDGCRQNGLLILAAHSADQSKEGFYHSEPVTIACHSNNDIFIRKQGTKQATAPSLSELSCMYAIHLILLHPSISVPAIFSPSIASLFENLDYESDGTTTMGRRRKK